MIKLDDRGFADIGAMTLMEARVFILFLNTEISRHQKDIDFTKERITEAQNHIRECLGRPLIYVAGPYSSDPEANVKVALKAGDALLKKGCIPYVPHLTHHWHRESPKSYEQWMEMGEAVLKRCDGLLRLPGDSPGADREVALAHKLSELG